MVFIYPAAVSKNADESIAVAVAKALEIYYIYQISESLTSGELRIYSKYDLKKKSYGPLIAENKLHVLTEGTREDITQTTNELDQLIKQHGGINLKDITGARSDVEI